MKDSCLIGNQKSMKKIQIKKIFSNAKLPTRANDTDAGYDLYSTEEVAIPCGATVLVSTGISMSIPKDTVGLIWDRSSMGVKGIHRHAGVIDSGYRGHVKVCLHNNSSSVYHVKMGDRVAQMIFQDAIPFELEEVESLEDTDRGDGGFGSSGK